MNSIIIDGIGSILVGTLCLVSMLGDRPIFWRGSEVPQGGKLLFARVLSFVVGSGFLLAGILRLVRAK